MLQIMNPRPLELSHTGGSNEPNIGIVVKCWENARPLIKELEQTVDFAERKCGDLMQQLNLCKEYYEKLSTERYGSSPTVHKRKPRKRFCRKSGGTQSSSENESEKVTTMQLNNFNEKLRNKIYEIANEIKEANRNIVLKEPCFPVCQRRSNDKVASTNQREKCDEKRAEDKTERDGLKVDVSDPTPPAEPVVGDVKNDNDTQLKQKEDSQSLKRTSSKVAIKRRSPVLMMRHTSMQKYKIRSKSLPQGVRRKFGFGSFVEVIVDKQAPKCKDNLIKIKSRTTVSSGSKSNFGKSGRRPMSRALDRSRSRTIVKPRSRAKGVTRQMRSEEVESLKASVNEAGDAQNVSSLRSLTDAPLTKIQSSVTQSELTTQKARSCSNFSNDLGLKQIKLSSSYISDENVGKLLKAESLLAGKHKFLTAPCQPIPFTICRTAKTFNLGLNIQQVLSLIKSKRHSSMLQAIIKDNIRTSRSVIQKTDANINTLYIATSSRVARTADTEVCPARDDGDQCYSVISTNTEATLKCKMLTCRRSLENHIIKEDNLQNLTDPQYPLVRQIKFNELRRPEDVWVVEQPDSHQSLQRFRSRCTCFPSRHSVDYHKVLKQYSRMKQCGQRPNGFQSTLCSTSFPRIMMSGTELCSLPSHPRITYNEKFIGSKLEVKKVQEDLDLLCRRYERVQEQLMQENVNDYEVDAELDSLELELSYRVEDCKSILNIYSQALALKKKVEQLRGRMRSSTNITEINSKPPRSRKDPFRPTPSMTLTRVLRQIQCLQDKIKLIDSPSIT